MSIVLVLHRVMNSLSSQDSSLAGYTVGAMLARNAASDGEVCTGSPPATMRHGRARRSRNRSLARRLLRPTVIAQAVAIVGIVLIGASVARSKQDPHVGTTPLGVGSRDRLAICIQPAEGLTLDPGDAIAAARAAFAELEKSPGWSPYAPYAVGGPAIDMGCPGLPALFRPILGQYPPSHPTNFRETVAATVVETPSPYRAFVIVMPDHRLSEVLVPELRGRRSTEETMCPDNNCVEVSVGIYISHSELLDPARLSSALAVSLGIRESGTSGQPSPSPRSQGPSVGWTPVPLTPKPERTLTPKDLEDLNRPR